MTNNHPHGIIPGTKAMIPRDYSDYVEHPRFGRRPRITGLDPDPLDTRVHLHWNATTVEEIASRYEALMGKKWPHGDLTAYRRDVRRIPNTAITADLSRQKITAVGVTHYFDLDRVCRACGRRFIFFAEEQKHWYEELGFTLNSDCVRCVPCRKQEQGIAHKRQRYEDLFHEPARTDVQTLEMAECCVELMEASVFTARQTRQARTLLNALSAAADLTLQSRRDDLLARVKALEEG
jgi:hypothetical protein